MGIINPLDNDTAAGQARNRDRSKATAVAPGGENINYAEFLQAFANTECYLSTRLQDLVKYNIATQKKGFSYRNITCGNEGNPERTINSFYSFESMRSIYNITSAEYSQLVPLIEFDLVFRSLADKKVVNRIKVPLQGTFIDSEELLANPASRMQTLGIRSFNFEFTGTDFISAGRQIKATATFYGDSLAVFKKTEYATILQKMDQNKNDIEHIYKVGWSAPPSMTNLDLRSAIKEANMTLVCSYTRHTFNIQQDGTFELVIEYIARLDISLNSVDLLKALKGDKVVRTKAKTEAENKFKNLINKAKKTNPKKPVDTQMLNQNLQTLISGLPDSQKQEYSDHLNKLVQKIINQGGLQGKTLEDFFKTQKKQDFQNRNSDAFKTIITELDKLGPKGESRIFNLFVSRRDFIIHTTDNLFHNSKFKDFLDTNPVGKFIKSTGLIGLGQTNRATGTSGTAPSVGIANNNASSSPKKYGPLNISSKIEAPLTESGDAVIQFFFLGDLFEILAKITNQQVKGRKVQYLLGSMPYTDPLTKKIKIVNLADVPISLETYKAFIANNYVKEFTGLVIPLNDFIRKLFQQVVKRAFSSECHPSVGVIGSHANLVTMHTKTLRKAIPTGRIAMDALQRNLKNRGENVDVVLFAANMSPSVGTTGNPEQDMNLGIYHYHLGRDSGLVKNADFKKEDLPYLSERRIVTNSDPLDQAREPYNVDLSMVGTNMFQPGTKFYLTPSIPGSDSYLVAKRLGLGGYFTTMDVAHSITTNSFTTTLRARSDQSLQIGEKRKAQKMRKGELLKSDKTSSNALSEQGPKRSIKSKNKD